LIYLHLLRVKHQLGCKAPQVLRHHLVIGEIVFEFKAPLM